MKRTLTLIIFFATIICSYGISGGEASKIINAVVNKLQSAPSVSAEFTLRSGANTTSGTIVFSGNNFTISTPQASSWFDGKTLWSFSASTNEVNISEPTDDEIAEINPFSFLSAARTNYNSAMLKSTSKATDVVELTAKNKQQSVSKAIVSVTKSTSLPSKLELIADGNVIEITITKISTGGKLSRNVFKFNKSAFPQAIEVDLR